jgi:hypothetical protein
MMKSDIKLFKKDKYLKDGGYNTLNYYEYMIDLDSKIYIAGHNGMVGSACWRALEAKGYKNIIGFSSKELDLRDQKAVLICSKEKSQLLLLMQQQGWRYTC